MISWFSISSLGLADSGLCVVLETWSLLNLSESWKNLHMSANCIVEKNLPRSFPSPPHLWKYVDNVKYVSLMGFTLTIPLEYFYIWFYLNCYKSCFRLTLNLKESCTYGLISNGSHKVEVGKQILIFYNIDNGNTLVEYLGFFALLCLLFCVYK